MNERRFFLDVKQSATGLAWHHRLDPRQENIALAIAQSHGIPDIVARVLAARNIELDAAKAFPQSHHTRNAARPFVADGHGGGGGAPGSGDHAA